MKYLDRDPHVSNNPEHQNPPENNEEEEPEKIGISGRFQWPIRTISFLIFASSIVGSYLGGLETIFT